MPSQNTTPTVTAITSRKVTSGMAKRLRAALESRHGLSVSGAQSTELVAATLGHPSANHMAAALNACFGASPDPDAYFPFTVILLDHYRDDMSIEHVQARDVEEAVSLATAEYQVRIANRNGAPTSDEEETEFLRNVGYAAVFSGHLTCRLREQDDALVTPEGEEAALRKRIVAERGDVATAFGASQEPANRGGAGRAREIVETRIAALAQPGIDWIPLMVDLLELQQILKRLERELGAQGEDLAEHAGGLLQILIGRIVAAAGNVGLRTGPVYGADPALKLFQMTGAYGDDGGYWGAHVPAPDREEARRVTWRIMSENTRVAADETLAGEPLAEDEEEIEAFEIVDEFDVSPREVATRDLVSQPGFNSWSSLERAARIELRAREYLQGAGL